MSYFHFFIKRKLLYTQLIKVVIGKYPGQFLALRDGPLENFFFGGGGDMRDTKQIFAQGKIKRKKFMHAD